MQAPNGPSRASSFASNTTASSPQNAALLGASKAFGRPKPRAGTGASQTGTVANLAGIGSSPQNVGQRGPLPQTRPQQLTRDTTGDSTASVKSIRDGGIHTPGSSTISHLGLPSQPRREHSRSPSLQAASVAAARAPPLERSPSIASNIRSSAPSVRRPAAPPKPRRLSGYGRQVDSEGSDEPTDSTSIAPTTSLVNMFERKASTSEGAKQRPRPIVVKPSNDLPLKSPKPVRASGGITSMFQMELEQSDSLDKPGPNDTAESQFNDLQPTAQRASVDFNASALEPSTDLTHLASSQGPGHSSSPNLSGIRKSSTSSLTRPQPLHTGAISIPQRSSGNLVGRAETFSPSSASVRSIPAQYHHMYPARRMTPNMTGDQLANAMVAGSLASSRAPSPHKSEPPPPPARRQKTKSVLSFSRTPSPTKTGMRHTLRKEESDSSETDDEDSLHPYGKHKKKRHIRKHPNKHHEGDRKRWRDAVTEAERKRYEGVWAANKGLHIGFLRQELEAFKLSPNSQETKDIKEASREEVCNLVVRDIWNRSRLPPHVLSSIWELVDSRGVGRLTKEEFVVGMWLIDQRLKGRKMPPKVGETVWASVRGLQGIKIRK